MGLTTSRETTPPQEDDSSSGESGTGSSHAHGNGNGNGHRTSSDRGEGNSTTMFTWNHGGQMVFVTGSWDNWEKKTALTRDPATGNHSVGLNLLPKDGTGVSYKYFVDGNWECNPSQPTRTDERGNTNNYLTICVPATDTATAQKEQISEPAYHSRLPSLASPASAAMAGDVPTLPRLLAPTKNLRKTHTIAPHIFVDRLFCSQGDPNVKTLSLQSRYQAKIITTIFVTPA